MEDDLKTNLFLIPLKFGGKPFLGLAQLSKIFCFILTVILSIHLADVTLFKCCRLEGCWNAF
jgi:hypothetical protein